MPTYEYECDACGHRFDLFQKISDPPAKSCLSCGKKKVRRLISAGAGFIFKGSGFYVTDSRKPKTERHKAKTTRRAKKSDSGDPA
jgi:putative FmdB family regulatory protein